MFDNINRWVDIKQQRVFSGGDNLGHWLIETWQCGKNYFPTILWRCRLHDRFKFRFRNKNSWLRNWARSLCFSWDGKHINQDHRQIGYILLKLSHFSRFPFLAFSLVRAVYLKGNLDLFSVSANIENDKYIFTRFKLLFQKHFYVKNLPKSQKNCYTRILWK